MKYSKEYKEIYKNLRDGVAAVNMNGCIIKFNEAFKNILGYDSDDLYKLSNDRLTPEKWHIIENKIIEEQVLVRGYSDVYEKEYIRNDGKVIPVELTTYLVKDEDNKPAGFWAFVRDITERKFAETQLRESEIKYRTLFENTGSGIIVIEEDKTISLANENFANDLGYRRDEIEWKMKWTEMVSDEDLEFMKKQHELRRINPEIAKTNYEFKFKNKNGELRDKLVFVSLIPGTKRSIASLIDIAERKIAEEEVKSLNVELEQRVDERTKELKAANDELRHTLQNLQIAQTQLIQTEKMASLGSLVAGVAHEINTPIGIGVTAASHLKKITEKLKSLYTANTIRKNDLDDFIINTLDSCDIILANIWRASEIITSFKDVAVDQSSEFRRDFNIKKYLEEILISLHPNIKKTHHKIIIECNDNLVINNFPGLFCQIITNLIMNSLIHAFASRDDGTIIIDIEKSDTDIILLFSDNGIGIPSENLSKIFDPFFTTKRGEGGTGLGLNIVYNIILQKLKGTISVESEPGNGTIFKISFPVIG